VNAHNLTFHELLEYGDLPAQAALGRAAAEFDGALDLLREALAVDALPADLAASIRAELARHT
jgi:hypothetical protein